MDSTPMHGIITVLDDQQQQERELGLRTALRELSEARSHRAAPITIHTDAPFSELDAPVRRRGLFRFADRARAASQDQ